MSDIKPKSDAASVRVSPVNKQRSEWLSPMVLSGILCALIGVIGGGVATYWLTERENQMRWLEYVVLPESGVIKKPELQGGKDLKVTLDNKPINNISTVTLYVFDRTGRSYKDVPINITISPNNGKAPALIQTKRMMAPEIYDEKQLPGLDDGSITYQYTIHVINPTNEASLQVGYVFEGDQAPSVKADVRYPGLGITPRQIIQHAEVPIGQMIVTVVGLIVCGATAFRLLVLNDRLNKRKRELEQKLSNAEAELKNLQLHSQILAIGDLIKHGNEMGKKLGPDGC
jgi:hypothetical protein